MPEVAVIGAAGYVGRLLCTRLAEDGVAVTGVVRPGSGFLLDHAGIDWLTSADASHRGPFDVVVNLAYPTNGSVYEYPEQNQQLFRTIQQLASGDGRVIQVSTQAVFGMALEYPQIAGPVPMRRDFLYVESKIELENLLIEQLGSPGLDVVRLGNVWGPGSAAWTGAVAQRLLFGEPVAVYDRDGFSNVTDVANLVSYVSFLARRDSGPRGAEFHHLAELGDVRWSYWIERISEQLGVLPVHGPLPAYSTSGKDEVRGTLRAAPRTIAKTLKDARFSGSTVRTVMRKLPPQASRTLRGKWAGGGAAGAPGPAEDLLLMVLSCDRPLAAVRDAGWTPPMSAEDSWSAVSSWLDEVGYT